MGHPGEADRKPTGNLQETRRKRAGNPQETRRKLAGNLQEANWNPMGNLQEARAKPTGSPEVTHSAQDNRSRTSSACWLAKRAGPYNKATAKSEGNLWKFKHEANRI